MIKAPISYYGGKTQLIPKIIPIIPHHTTYSESFFGSGAIFFAKEPAKIEIINDVNKNVINFYKIAKRQFKALKSEIDVTLYSEEQYLEARAIYRSSEKEEKDSVLRAWALYVLSHQTFLSDLENSWNYSRTRNVAKTFQNKKEAFDSKYVKRLESTQIFCRDALKVIKQSDSPETFHFIDPPYFNSDCGHYSGYTEKDFIELLKVCEKLSGKFLLTSYPSDTLKGFKESNNWFQVENVMHKAASCKEGETKTEVFTTNYAF